jgi:hypothetical protein
VAADLHGDHHDRERRHRRDSRPAADVRRPRGLGGLARSGGERRHRAHGSAGAEPRSGTRGLPRVDGGEQPPEQRPGVDRSAGGGRAADAVLGLRAPTRSMP